MVCRTFKRNEYCNISFASTIFFLFLFYFIFSYEFLIHNNPSFKIPLLVIFTILTIFTFWSFFMTAFTEPGRVPFFWGLYDETNLAQRKYCLICHGFKPERCHHCSTCQKCVLNMDHHCPWVNNCIGFHNRKFFMLFLFYISICLLIMSIVEVIVMISEIKKVAETKQTDVHFALKLILTLATLPLFFALISFFFFHLKMVLVNTTTLEGLIRKKQGANEVEDYDCGRYENFVQVFGQNGFFWLIPIYGDGPKGSGVNWGKNNVKHGWASETKTVRETSHKKF